MLKPLIVACLGISLLWLHQVPAQAGDPVVTPELPTVKAQGRAVTGSSSLLGAARRHLAVVNANSGKPAKSKPPGRKKAQRSATVSEKPYTGDQFCRDIATLGRAFYGCGKSRTVPPAPSPRITKAHAEAQLRQVVTQLKLPDPTPRFGPDPSVNEWKMLAVGFPVWLWTDSPKTITSTATKDGLTFTLKATWTSTTFRMGDGHTKTCSRTSVYPAHIDKPGSPSPTCGYIYDTASPKGHPYTVTAETHWRIDWSTGGQTGSFNHTYTGNRTLEIGELASMIKR